MDRLGKNLRPLHGWLLIALVSERVRVPFRYESALRVVHGAVSLGTAALEFLRTKHDDVTRTYGGIDLSGDGYEPVSGFQRWGHALCLNVPKGDWLAEDGSENQE